MLADSVPHKRPIVSLVSVHLDVFAESNSDVGTTGFTFHKLIPATLDRFANLFDAYRMVKCEEPSRLKSKS